MTSIYTDIILEHASSPSNSSPLPHPDCVMDHNNPLCGDRAHAEIGLEGDLIKDISIKVTGCAISTAAASLLTEYLKGKRIEELQKMNGDSIVDILGIPLTPARMRCALLGLETVKKAYDETKNSRS